MKIQLMNLERQYAEKKQEFDKAVLDVLSSGKYIGGEIVNKFEKEFALHLGAYYCVSCGNGTDALVIALRALGIGRGDEVITVSFTFFATAESISAVGATPVFIDVDKDTYCMDPKLIEAKINKNTKVILPVHIYGNPCEMDEIMAIAKKHGLYVIEDCAQAANCKYKGVNVGTIGDVGCFSFFPTKIMGCAGDGGAIISNNKRISDACRSYKLHGSGLLGFEVMKEEYLREGKTLPQDINIGADKYHNYLIGYNSRLDAVQAALLLAKLKYLDDYIIRRRDNAKKYMALLKGSKYQIQTEKKYAQHGYYVFAVAIDNAKDIMAQLNAEGVEVHTYYPVPLHLQGVYATLGYKRGDLPITEWLSDHSFAIPVYPELKNEELNFVVQRLLEYGK
ncbi:MAG: DegT/DnrJ/EryC1/StrS family aminotransferase [Bacilli bacterium]